VARILLSNIPSRRTSAGTHPGDLPDEGGTPMNAEPLRTPHVPLSSTEKVGWIAAICREALSADSLSQALDQAVLGLVEKVGYFSCSIGLLDSDGREVVNRAWCSRASDAASGVQSR
jgi:hypothetical protein